MQQNFEYYPLTHPQKGIWYTEKLYPDTSIGIIAATLKIHGNVDYAILEKAVNLLIEKNEAIRFRITEKDNQPYQYVDAYKYKKLDFIDFSNLSDGELFRWDKCKSEEPFVLLNSDLFYFALIKISENVGGFFVKMHHLISDAWSMSIVGNSIVEFYSKIKNGEEIDPVMKPSYVDYILRENDYFESSRYISDKEFWTNRLSNFQDMTTIKPRTALSLDIKAKRKTFILPKKLTDKLRKYCNDNKVSEFTLFFAALSMYITRTSGKEDLTIGTTLLNRTNAKEKSTFGMFVSTAVPIRIRMNMEWNLQTFADSISKEILSVFRHQKYPYTQMLKQVREQNNVDNVFDIVLTYQNSKFQTKSYEQFTTRWHFSGYQIESLIVNINDRDNDEKFIIDYDYLASMFSSTEIDFIHQHIVNILWHSLDDPQKRISKLEMISEFEKHKIVKDFNNTECDYQRGKTIHQLFQEQVRRMPDKVAAIFEGETITYSELNKKANQLANLLRQKGVVANQAVSIMVQRSLKMIIGILGILKAGGAYLPIDPKYPAERREYILKNSKAEVLLTQDPYINNCDFSGEIINLDDDLTFSQNHMDLNFINKPDDLVYIIYTSGSTGNPKGAMIEHHSLINRLNWMQKKYPLDDKSSILQKTTYTFDVSVWELIWPLLVGAKQCFLVPDGEKDPEAIIRAIERNDITTMHFVPSMLNMFLNYLEQTNSINRVASLKQVFASGEALSIQQVEKFNWLLNRTNGTALANLYGPTEASIDVTYFDCSPEIRNLKTVPIGRPIDNTKIFILDKNMTLLPIGIAGELYIGGVGVARGYINNEELTNEKFIDNPFYPGEIIYRTGDLARWYPKGDIEYLGRIDTQVKIRGFRIELGEVEKRLLEHDYIKDVVVIGKLKPNGENYLCAYYVSDAQQLPFEELKAHLLNRLPDYMIPSCFIWMKHLPLLPNGKIDRKSLPEANLGQKASAIYEAPSNDIEGILLRICQECLEKDDFGINDNLFDLGGDSLTIIDILIRVHKYNWGLTAADFYYYQTIKLLAGKILGDISDEELGDELTGVMNLQQFRSEYSHKKAREMNNVLITGATGYLGIHILKEILDNTKATIFCLVRGRSKNDAEDKFEKTFTDYFSSDYYDNISERVHVVNGDISYDRFLLPIEQYSELSKKIDTVVHSAAIVKYYGKYSDFANTNVLGTKRITDFTRENNKKLYYISTLAIAGSYLADYDGDEYNFTEEDYYIGQNYKENVYVRSKFEAEMVVYKDIKQGLDATIFRMGNLTGRYLDGHFQNNIQDNAFYSIIRSICLLSSIPEDQLNIDVELTPVDLAGKAIFKLMHDSTDQKLLYHIMNHHEVTIGQLINMFSKLGMKILVLNKEDFREVVREVSEDEALRNILSGIIADMSKDDVLDYRSRINIDSALTQKCLADVGFDWPEMSLEYISKVIGYMQAIGFIEKVS